MTEKLFCSSDSDFVQVAENYKRIKYNADNALARSGRTDNVRIMAVTKTVEPEKVNFAAGLGIDLLGENRVQEFLGKYENYDKKCEIHFIGGLQNNKVKYIIDKVSMVHSVDSLKLAEEISGRAFKNGLVMDVLLEVNIAGEETKGGVAPEMLDELIGQTTELEGIRLRGLMTIPPLDVKGSNERYFSQMQRLFTDYQSKLKNDGRVQFDTLSMGMSRDYEKAIEYGSTIVRIGSSLFGYRK